MHNNANYVIPLTLQFVIHSTEHHTEPTKLRAEEDNPE